MSDEVRQAVRDWLARAEADWQAVRILARHRRPPRETVGFHCQQYVEKLLKGLLTRHGIEFPKTHSLRRLIQLAAPAAPELAKLADRSDELTLHAVLSRYPDTWRKVGAREMKKMIALAEKFAGILLPRLRDEPPGLF